MRNVTELTNLFFSCYPNLRKAFRNLMSIKNVPISVTQLTCIVEIDKDETLTMSELADRLNMSNQQLTKVMDGLVELKLAERVCDQTNRRKFSARPTEEGKRLLNAFRKEITVKLGAYFQRHSDKSPDKLYDSLEYVASYFQENE